MCVLVLSWRPVIWRGLCSIPSPRWRMNRCRPTDRARIKHRSGDFASARRLTHAERSQLALTPSDHDPLPRAGALKQRSQSRQMSARQSILLLPVATFSPLSRREMVWIGCLAGLDLLRYPPHLPTLVMARKYSERKSGPRRIGWPPTSSCPNTPGDGRRLWSAASATGWRSGAVKSSGGPG